MKDLSEDRAWLDAFRAGEAPALERVFRTYAPYVCAIVRRSGTRLSAGATLALIGYLSN